MRSRVTPVLARAVTGGDLTPGATDIYVPLDGIPGAPLRSSMGDHAHVVGLRISLDCLLDTTNTMTNLAAGALMRAIVTNLRLRAGGLEVIDGSVDGEEITTLMDCVHGFRLSPDPINVPDATTANVSESEINIDIRFDDLTDAFGRENDCGIPLAAFSTARDKEHGLRFSTVAASALVKLLTGVQVDTAGAAFTRMEVYALIRYSKEINLKTPTRYRFYNEARADFEIDLKGGGQWRCLIGSDAPAAGTGLRDHIGYSNISLNFNGEVVYTGRSAIQLARMFNMARISPAQRLVDFDPTPSIGVETPAITGLVAAAKSTIKIPGIIVPANPQLLPLYLPAAGASKQDLPEGRANVSIGTRSTTAQRLGYAWLPDPDAAYAENTWAGAGLPGKPRLYPHSADKSALGRAATAKRLPIAGK